MWKLFCRHSTVSIFRAHEKSWFGLMNAKNTAWIDKLGVHNFIVCVNCDKVVQFKHREFIYGEQADSN